MELVVIPKSELEELLKSIISLNSKPKAPIKEAEIIENLLDKKQAAKLLNVSLATIDNYRRNGLIPSYRIGSAVRFKRSELIEAITAK